MRKMNLITRFLCSCAGCDIATLDQCNSAEQRKMAIIGSSVLITPMLGIASGTFAILTFSKSLPLSIGFGLLWGFVIFIIERAVVANTRPGEFNMGVLARLMLACIFAMVVAVPMELKVFEDAIQEKLANNLIGNIKDINIDYDTQIEKINKKLNAEKSNVDALRLSYIGEVDGTSGSKVAYRGPIAQEKKMLWDKEIDVYSKMAADAKTEIDILNKERGQIITAKSESQAVGFLGRMSALGVLSKEDNTILWGVWLIRLFFLAIELTPIFIKLSSGKSSNVYHDIAKQNGAMAVSVNSQMEEVRAEEMIKQQRAMVNKELFELQLAEEKAVMDDALKRFDLYMAQLKKVSDRKLQVQQHFFVTVKDEQTLHHLMVQVEQIYEDFEQTLSQLVNRRQAGGNFINDISKRG